MLNELSDLETQAREIRSEINCLLDCFIELVDLALFLEDDNWDEADESDDVLNTFSQYGFLGDSEEEELVENDHLELIQKYSYLYKQSPKKKRSRSPLRKPLQMKQA